MNPPRQRKRRTKPPVLPALIEPAFAPVRQKKESVPSPRHAAAENGRVRHPNRRKRWTFANLEPMEDKLDREKKRGRLRAFVKKMKDKRHMRRQKKALRKEAMSSQAKIEAEAWENT